MTKDNVKDTVVADGFWTASDICTRYAPTRQASSKAGRQYE